MPCAVVLTQHWRVTDGRTDGWTDTDGIAVASTALVMRALRRAVKTRLWANAQRDGRPAEYKWHPLFNAAKFG